MASIGEDLSTYQQRNRPRAVGPIGFLTDRRNITANARTRFELKVDTRGPVILSRLSLTLANLPYPQAAAVAIFVSSAEADLLYESGEWVRDQLVRNRPHLYATPIGSGGIYGGCDFPVSMVVRQGSVIEVEFEETGGVTYNATLVGHVSYPTKDPIYKRIGDIQVLEPEKPGQIPEPVGRVYMVGDHVLIGAGLSGDFAFNLRSPDIAYADQCLVTMDTLPLFAGGLATLPINVSQIFVQYEGLHEASPLLSGVPANLMAVLGGTGAVGARLFDRSMRLEPSSDFIVTMNNIDVNPHTMDGCLVVHRH